MACLPNHPDQEISMHQFYVDYMERLTDLHNQIREGLDGLPAEALDWSPGPEMNSMDVLVVHLTGAERYWIGDVAGQEPSGRDRAAEFRTQDVAAQDLLDRLEASRGHAQAVLARLSLAELSATRPSERHPKQTFTVATALLHALEHTGQHLGHIQMVRQLFLTQPPAQPPAQP